jgi:hypothetical protein
MACNTGAAAILLQDLRRIAVATAVSFFVSLLSSPLAWWIINARSSYERFLF